MTTITQSSSNDTAFDGLDERMMRELAAHDLWVAETEKRLRSQAENDQEPQCDSEPRV